VVEVGTQANAENILDWPVLRYIDTINSWVGRLASFLLLGFAGVVVYEVVVRYVFNAPTIWSLLTSQYMFGVYFLLGGGYALLNNTHVRVDILHSRFSPRTRAILDIITSVFFFALCTSLIWKGGAVAIDSVVYREIATNTWNPPIYPLRLMIPIGAILIALQGIVQLIRNFAIAIKGGGQS